MLCLLATHLNCFLVLFGRISAVRSSPILSHYPGILCYVMSQSGKKKKKKKETQCRWCCDVLEGILENVLKGVESVEETFCLLSVLFVFLQLAAVGEASFRKCLEIISTKFTNIPSANRSALSP